MKKSGPFYVVDRSPAYWYQYAVRGPRSLLNDMAQFEGMFYWREKFAAEKAAKWLNRIWNAGRRAR